MIESPTADALYRTLREARAEYRTQAPPEFAQRLTPPPESDEPPLVDRLVAEFVRRVREEFGDNLVSLILYGSVARGDYKPQSDIDLLMVCEELPGRHHERSTLVREIERAIERTQKMPERWTDDSEYHMFSVILKTRGEAEYTVPYYLDMTTDARILVDKCGFFGGVLARLRERLGELGSKKLYLEDGHWYWDLKPDTKYGEAVEI